MKCGIRRKILKKTVKREALEIVPPDEPVRG